MGVRLLLVIGIVLTAWPCDGRAQAIRLDVRDGALEAALHLLRTQAGVDIVFAGRLVDGRRTTCRYEGPDAGAALACLLDDTGLQAEQVRRRQYVLIAGPEPASGPEVSPVYGMLAGFVSDAETGETLPGAHVYLAGLRVGTVTNEAGYFAIPTLPPSEYRVRVSYLGYRAVDTLMTADRHAKAIRLEPVALETGDVVVEGDVTERADLAVVPGVIGASVGQLEKLPSFPGEHDLFRALQWFPGVQKAGEVNGGLVVRGGEPDQNLYLLDGAPVYHPWHAFSLISTFQTETFKDIQLYRGAFPAEHGGRLASVLDAQMRDGSRTAPRAVAGLSLLSARLMAESPITRNSSFMVAGRRSYLDTIIGREHPVEGADGRRDTLRTGYYFYDMSAKYTVRSGPRHRLSVSYYQGGDDLDLRLPFDLSLDFSSWLRPSDLLFEVDQEWQNRLFSTRYQYLYSRRLFMTAMAYRSSYQAREGTFMQPTSSARLHSDYRVFLRDIGLKLDVDYYHSLAHQVQMGVQAVEHRFESDLDAHVWRSPAAVDSLRQASALRALELVGYVQDTWQPTPQWKVQPGVRLSYLSGGRYVRLNPTINLQYALPTAPIVLRAGAGTHTQYLHRIRDRYSLIYDLVSSRWIPASREVRPSASLQVTAGSEVHPFDGVTLSSDVYWRYADGILLPEDAYQSKDGLVGPGIEVGTLLGQYTPGRSRAYGVEVAARAVRGPWEVLLSYAGGRSVNRAPDLGERVYRPARFDVPRSFRGVLHRAGRHWSFTFSADLRSGYPHSVPVARYALRDPLSDPEAPPVRYLYRPSINNGRLPPYVRFDAVVGYRFTWGVVDGRVQVQLYNLLNHRNVISRTYDPAPAVVSIRDRRGLPLLPLLEVELEL